jgi:outer membrane protein TolC
MERLVAVALARSPRVAAAHARAESAAAARAGDSGFFDPQLTASAGYSDWSRSAPGFRASTVTRNAVGVEAGVNQAVVPGFYLGVGAAERYLTEPGDDRDALYQTLLGAQVWVPVGRDRGFRLWRWDDLAALHAARAAAYRWLAEAQNARRAAELAYVDLLLAWADEAATAEAVRRAEKLLAEAEELARLKAIPAYQAEAARLDVALNREEAESAAQATLARAARLAEVVGAATPEATNRNAEAVAAIARSTTTPASVEPETACRWRGDCLAALASAEAAAFRQRRAVESGKPDVAVSASVTWQGEDERSAWGGEALTDEETTGAEVALIWRQALGRRRERAEARAAGADVQAAREDVAGVRLRVATDLRVARAALESAQRRLQMGDAAVEHAVRAMDAENERFRMGEGRSRNVLDAQKDVTKAVQRRNGAAAALLAAASEAGFAMGYGGAVEATIGFPNAAVLGREARGASKPGTEARP